MQNINLLNCVLHSKIVETKCCGNVHDAFTYPDGPLQRQYISARFHSVISKITAILNIFHTRVYVLYTRDSNSGTSLVADIAVPIRWHIPVMFGC